MSATGSMPGGSECWYAVSCKPRQEEVAQDNLSRQGYQVYLPRLQIRKRRGRNWVDSIEALFPRYLFIRLDPSRRSTAPVRSTRGVCGLVRFGSQAAVVPDCIIRAIRQREDAATGLHAEPRAELRRGELVRLTAGPLAGVEAVFERRCGEERVMLLLDLLGKANNVAVLREWVEKAA